MNIMINKCCEFCGKELKLGVCPDVCYDIRVQQLIDSGLFVKYGNELLQRDKKYCTKCGKKLNNLYLCIECDAGDEELWHYAYLQSYQAIVEAQLQLAVKRLEQMDKAAKGYWNVSDLARIKEWVDYLSAEFNLGLTADAAIIGEQANIPQVVNNVEAIRNGHTWSWTPTTPDFISWNYIKANSVERILYDANHHEGMESVVQQHRVWNYTQKEDYIMNISIERLLELVKKRYLKKEVLTETEQRELAEAIFYISTGYRFDI